MAFCIKLSVAITLFCVLALGLLAVGLISAVEEPARGPAELRAERSVRALAAGLAGHDETDIARIAAPLLRSAVADDGPLYAALTSPAGRRLAELGAPAAARQGTADAIMRPVRLDGVTVAELALIYPSQRNGLWQTAGAYLAIELVLIAALSLLAGCHIQRRFRRLRDTTEQVCRTGATLPVRGNGPLAEVGAAINRVAAGLADAHVELRAALQDSRALGQRLREVDGVRQRLIEANPDGVVTIDGDGLLAEINPAAERLFGSRREDVLGRPIDTLLRDVETADGEGPASRLLFPGTDDAPAQGGRRELVLPRRDGGALELDVTVMEASDGAGRLRTLFLRDIRERSRYQRLIAEAEQRAQQAGASRSRFLASMSHEIRTPLNAILNMNDLLLESGLNPNQRGYATTANEAARSLLSIVNGVLDFSKLEAGRLEPAPEPCDPEEVMRSVVDLLAARAHAKSIQLTTFTAPAVPAQLRMDPGLVRQILLNLIGNAIKFTDAGGVRVRLELMRASDLAAPMGDDGDMSKVWLAWQVFDTGIGIPEREQPRLFEEFFQADSSGSRRSAGSGLGLALSRRLAQLLGGDILLHSKPGEGSRFDLALPVVLVKDVAPRGDAAQALHQWSVTLVVQDALVAEDLAAQLRAFGIEAAPEPTLAGARLPEGCCGELRLRRRADAGEERRIRLYALGSHCEQPPGQTAATLRLPVVSGRLLTVLNEVIDPSTAARQAAPEDDLMDRLRRVAATAKTILLVEDSHANQLVATTLLANAGLRIDVAENGLQAVAAVNRGDYGLVLMDLTMPEMDGLEATGCIRDMPGKRGRVPIVAMTANVFADDRQRCLDAGMNDFLIKPIEREALYEAVLRWLAGQRSYRGLPASASWMPDGSRSARRPVATAAAPLSTRVAATPAQPATGAADAAPLVEVGQPEVAAAEAPEDAGDAPPVLDLAAIAELEAGLSADLMPTVIAAFIDEVQQRLAEIERHSDAGDAVAAGDEGHGLKGSAATFAAAAVEAIAFEIECAGRAGDIDGVRSRLGPLRFRCSAAISALRARYPQESVS